MSHHPAPVPHVPAQAAADWLARHAGSILQHSTDAIICTTVHDVIVGWNPAAEQLLRCPQSQALGQSIARFIPDPPAGVPATHESHWQRADRTMVPVSVTRVDETDGYLYIVRDMSACHEDREQLRARKAQLRKLYEATPAMLLSMDLQGRLLTVSDLWLDRLGLMRRDVIGRSVLDFLAPGSRQKYRNLDILSCFQRGQADRLPMQFANRDGRPIDVLVSAILETDEQGQPIRCIAVLDDVTLRMAAERNLEHERQRLANIIAGTRAGTMEWNLDTGKTRYNESWAQLYGYSAAELGARTMDDWTALAHPDDIPRYAEQVRRHLAGELPAIEIESRIRHKDGHWVWVLDRAKVFEGVEVPGSRWIAGIRIDIHQQKDAVEQLAEAESRSHSVLDLLSNSIEALDEAFALYDPQDRLTLFNQPYKRLFPGLDHMLVHGKRFEDIIRAALANGQYPEARGRQDEWLHNRLRAHADPVREIVQRYADGRIVRIMERRMADGHTVVSVSDISTLVKASDEARIASQAKSRFLANMSHEIRTPMNAVIGMLALLRRTTLTTQQTDYADKADRAAGSLLRLVDDILDFSKIEAGKLTLENQPFNLDNLLHELAVMLDVMVRGKAVRLCFEVDARVPAQLVGDAMRLQQVLVNLASNAVKFTERGDITLAVSLAGETDAGAVLNFSVQDTGIGIAPENQPQVFGAFMQAETSTTRRFGGTGLGLSISRHLTRMMGSDLQLQSELGKGSRFHFTVTLPVPAGSTCTASPGRQDVSRLARKTRPAPSASRAATSTRLAGLRVLVAEDNATNRQVVQELLALEGAQVTLVNDGHEAVQLLERARALPPLFDAVLMDLQMPVMDGLTATRRIRQMPHAATLPIIAMTANVMESDRQACADAGMNAHVGKPFDLNNLVQVLAAHAPAHADTKQPVVIPIVPAPPPLLADSEPVTCVSATGCGSGKDCNGAVPGMGSRTTACASVTTASAAGVDMSDALQRVGGRCDLYTRMLEGFLADLDDMQRDLSLPVTQDSRRIQSRAAHTLKGAAAMVGARTLSLRAAETERTLNGKVPDEQVSAALHHLCQALAEARPGMHALVRTLQSSGATDERDGADQRFDPEAFRSALQGLAGQLRHFDMGAVDTVGRLMADFCTAGQWLTPVNDAITVLDFGRAASLCDKLLEEAPA